jgi:hypothetical protein
MDADIQEKIDGYISLLSVRPIYARTSYPYSQLNQVSATFTKNKIEILARKEDEYKSAFTVARSESTDYNKRPKSKKGGTVGKSSGYTAGIVFYG